MHGTYNKCVKYRGRPKILNTKSMTKNFLMFGILHFSSSYARMLTFLYWTIIL